jgi:hypothetical protein
MAKRIKQFRFFGTADTTHNTPNTNFQTLVSGNLFADILPILQLGIQALPGTKFYVNSSTSPVIVGVTGVYEMSLQDNTQITSLSFDGNSLQAISNSSTGGLIIDVTYDNNNEGV